MQDTRLRDSLGYALVKLFRQVNREHGRALTGEGLSAEQAHILLVLWLAGPMKVGELQRFLSLGSGTLSGALDRMEQAGLLSRAPDPTDRRAYRIEPARVDSRKRRRVEQALETTEARCFEALTKAERTELLRLMRKVSASLP